MHFFSGEKSTTFFRDPYPKVTGPDFFSLRIPTYQAPVVMVDNKTYTYLPYKNLPTYPL